MESVVLFVVVACVCCVCVTIPLEPVGHVADVERASPNFDLQPGATVPANTSSRDYKIITQDDYDEDGFDIV